jgi:hypothetical protein
LQAIWLKGLKGEEREKRIKEILSYRNAFDALKELLEDQYEESVPDYDCPSWSHKQADVNGANRKLRQIISLLDIKEPKNG